MKIQRTLSLFVFLWVTLICLVEAQSLQWRALPSAPAEQGRLEDIFFLNASNGWTVNLAGEIYRTRDGGNTWQLLWKDTSAAFRSIGFADSLRGWAGTVFSTNPLYETKDGGAHWTPVDNLPASRPSGICGLSVVNDSVVYGVGTFFQTTPLIKTVDGGKTWNAIDLSSQAKTLIDVRFFSADSGFVTGGFAAQDNAPLADLKAVILFTANGGQTWETRYHSDSLGTWTWKLAFPSGRTVFASVERFSKPQGIVLKSLDGGARWSETFFNGQSDVQGVGFVDSLHGWVGTHDSSYTTEDGGNTWHPFEFWTGPNAINRIRMLNDTLGYAAGKTVFKFSRATPPGALSGPRSHRPEPTNPGLRSGPNPFRDQIDLFYSLATSSFVTLTIYDFRGKLVRTLVNGRLPAGNHTAYLKAQGLPRGPYLARLRIVNGTVNGLVSALELWRLP